MSADTLRPADVAGFARLGIPLELLVAAGVRRVTHAEARDLCGIRYKSEHLESLAFPYLDPEDDRVLTWRVRRDHPEVETDGKPIAKYLTPPDRHHLYFAPGSDTLLADPSVSVVIVEAEKSVLALTAGAARANRRLLAIGIGGCWGWRGVVGKATNADGVRVDEKGPLADFDRVVWRDRDVVIVFDTNVATNTKVQAARLALASELAGRGAHVWIADLPVEDEINGPDDYIGKHGDAALFALLDAAKPARRSQDLPIKESQATAIVRLAIDAGADLWHTPADDGYITIRVSGHAEHHSLASRGTRDYLTRILYRETGTVPNAGALQDAIATLSGMARFDGTEHDVYVRVALGAENRIYLDLADQLWRAVEVSPYGWQVINDPPVRFRRPRGVLPLPVPARGGSIDELHPFLNVGNDDDFALVVCWLISTIRPRGPYPVLALVGEQGTAKTTTARAIRRTVDPNVSDVRSEPREARDLAVAADNGHIIAFDNISRLPEWLSDAICRLATGGGFATRRLYENREEEIFEAVRPVIVNGIAQVAVRGDLIDRIIVATLPVISDANRRDEEEFWLAFEQARPRILGALLEMVVMALGRKPDVRLENKPRMADFALWAVAAEPACPWPEGTFLRVYTGNRQGAVEAQLDGDPVVDVVHAIAPWTGTASELLAELNKRTPDSITKRKGWFSKPRQVSDSLRRLAPGLRKTGIEVTFDRAPHTRRRLITLERMGDDTSPSSPSFSEPDFRPSAEDDSGTQGDAERLVGRQRVPLSSPDSARVSSLRTEGDDGDGLVLTHSETADDEQELWQLP